MPAFTIIVTSVGIQYPRDIGPEPTSFGSGSIATALLTFYANSTDLLQVSTKNFIYRDGDTGAAVQFLFTTGYQTPSTYNVPFDFSNDRVITSITIYSSIFGNSYVVNEDLAVSVPGYDNFISGTNRASDLTNLPDLLIAFSTTYVTQSPLNVGIYFGGSPVVTSVSVGDTFIYGSLDIRVPLAFVPRPGVDFSGFGTPRIGDKPDVVFDFLYTYVTPSTLNVPFNFSSVTNGALNVGGVGYIDEQFGATFVRNYAINIVLTGFDSFTTIAYPARTAFSTPWIQGVYSGKGYALDFRFFDSSYVPYTALNTPFYFYGQGDILTYGEDGSDFGITGISFRVRTLTVSSVGSTLEIPPHSIKNLQLFVNQSGFQDTFNNIYVRIKNISDIIYPVYWTDSVVPEPLYAGDRKQVVKLNGKGINAVLWSISPAAVTNYYRFYSISGILSQSFGSSVIGYGVRRITCTGLHSFEYGLHLVGPKKFVTPGNWVSSYVYENLSIENRALRPAGINSLEIGPSEFSYEITRIYNRFGFIRYPIPIDDSGVGSVKLYNTRQYLYCVDDIRWNDYDHRGFGLFGRIENRNKELGPWGLDVSWVSWYSRVDNSGRAVYPDPILPPVYDSIWVAGNYTRYIRTKWLEPSSQVRMWHYIENKAVPLTTKGFIDFLIGVGTTVELYKRYLTAKFIYEDLVFGNTVTGYTPTEIPVRSYDYSSVFSTPRISFGTWYVYPSGITGYTKPGILSEPQEMGFPTIIGPFHLEIKPRTYGDGSSYVSFPVRVYNLTPELIPTEKIFNEALGVPWISFWVRRVLPISFIAYGPTISTYIRDRLQYITMLGVGKNYLAIPLTHKVELYDLYLAVPKFIFCSGFFDSKYTDNRQTYIYGPLLPEGFSVLSFGQSKVVSNGIAPKSILSPFFMANRPNCTVTKTGPQYITFKYSGVFTEKDLTDTNTVVEGSVTSYGFHRVDPYTVYCTNDGTVLTGQALANARLTKQFYGLDVDKGDMWFSDTDIVSPEFEDSGKTIPGYPYYRSRIDVANKNRSISPESVPPHLVINKPKITSTLHYVYCKGVNVFKFSLGIEVWPYTQEILLLGFDMPVEFGEVVALWTPPITTQYLYQRSYIAVGFGRQLVQNWVQDLYLSGFDNMELYYDMHRLMVHFPFVLEPSFFDVEIKYGIKTFIDFRIRTISPDGIDSLSTESDEDFIHEFLSIRISVFRVSVTSIIDEYLGQAKIYNVYQYIRAYGIQGSRCLGRNSINT